MDHFLSYLIKGRYRGAIAIAYGQHTGEDGG